MRYNESQVNDFIAKPNNVLVTIKMSDNLSDSGIIGICLASNENGNLLIKENTVSCRALGRNLEDIMLPYMYDIAYNKLGCTGDIILEYKKGEKNAPALNWLKNHTDISLNNNGSVIIPRKEIDTNGLIIEVINE